MRFETIIPPWLGDREDVRKVMRACGEGIRAAGFPHSPAMNPSWRSEVIVLWGIGHPSAQQLLRKADSRGVRVICWDLGYWNRNGDSRFVRFGVNALHPISHIDSAPPSARGPVPEISSDSYSPSGPILVCGMGWKSARAYGEAVGEWEQHTVAALRKRGIPVMFRPKPGNPLHCQSAGCEIESAETIWEAMKGKSLVVVRHSNVALDALIAGVPFECQGSIATRFSGAGVIADEVRREFLARLSWFQWTISELRTAEPWRFIEGII